ncbi:MmcQ/YjbR family DNA-binding protein [Leucobacter massiliensis]|uniref:Cytoplasmic protein n=1 Tax=Leucobacter massiliensis TaxID=1686285 RepID=A0A2S9QQ46_9MICO|nr:MmcQ/YjbR family DNA-binding protein [Leucobacter massiliensis]PRI11713.1 hypothetical protein B4915_04515 [Leucobacter massiliensis]
MDGEELHRLARARTAELPGAELTHPFGEQSEVYKVRGRMFLLLTEHAGERIVNAKARPADARVLREAYGWITPGYHMNKQHWISLRPAAGDPAAAQEQDPQLVEDLITESYLLVLEKNVPKSQWPVNPATFGQSAE